LRAYGGRVIRTKVGDRHVMESMREQRLTLGGEPSGHIVMLEHNTTGDAVIAALHVLATLIRRDQPMSALADVYQPLPEAHAKVPLNVKRPPTDEQLEAIQREAGASLNGDGCVVIRRSGTEPVIRIMVQQESIRKAEALAKELASRIESL
jgi:phosphoglucosamine mutase